MSDREYCTCKGLGVDAACPLHGDPSEREFRRFACVSCQRPVVVTAINGPRCEECRLHPAVEVVVAALRASPSEGDLQQDDLDRKLGANIRKALEYELAINEGGLDLGRGRIAFAPMNQEADDLYYVEGTLVTVQGRGVTLDVAAENAAQGLVLPSD